MPEKTGQKEPGKKPAPSKKPKPQQEVVVQISLSELHPFPDHPFQVREDASMQETAESVKEYGVLVPALARPREDGGYELIAGHRRKHACELAGLATMPVIVRDIDRDAATIIMVDSNLQRENILPSERAQAYKMKLEAIRRKAGRPVPPPQGSQRLLCGHVPADLQRRHLPPHGKLLLQGRDRVRLCGAENTSPHNYVLFMAARDLCGKTEAVTMADLAEPEVIDPEALRLIVNATLIARYGLAAFQIRARGAEYER